MRLIFDGRPHHTLNVDGETVHGQEEFEVSDERGAELLAQPGLRVHDPDEPGEPENPIVVSTGDGQKPVRRNRAKGARRKKAAAADPPPNPRSTVEIPIGTAGEGWVEVEQPPESILDPQSTEGTVVITPAQEDPTHACVTVTGATPESTATVTYAVSV